MMRALPSGYGGRAVRAAPPTDPNVTHGNAAICRRNFANSVAGDRKKKDTDALLIDEPNIIAAKMAAALLGGSACLLACCLLFNGPVQGASHSALRQRTCVRCGWRAYLHHTSMLSSTPRC
jgi:hypothetical protein